MKFSETIESLLDNGALTVVFGKTPDDKRPFVKCSQVIQTGPEGNHIVLEHQSSHTSFENCLNQIKRDVDHCSELQTKTVQIRDTKN